MRALVTGGHGFIGRHLVARLLAGGTRVRCLYRRPGAPDSLSGMDVEIAPGDLRAPEGLAAACRDVDVIFHLAGLTRSRTRREMLDVNAAGTARLYGAARRAGVPGPFVFCSSASATGPAPSPAPWTEAAAAAGRPVSWYGESKRAAEQVLRRHEAAGPPVVVLRPPGVYGPGDRDFLTLFQGAARGFLVVPADGDAAYSFVFAEDLAAALVAAAEAPAARGRAFFACHPEVVDLGALAAAAEAAVGRTTRRLLVPRSLVGCLGRGADLWSQLSGRASLLGTQRVLEVTSKHWVYSPRAFEAASGWRADVDLRTGFARTASWYVGEGLLRAAAR